MNYGFFLDRVDLTRDHFAVDEELEFSADILADSAEPDSAFWYVAVSGTGRALDSSSFQWMIEHSFFDHVVLASHALIGKLIMVGVGIPGVRVEGFPVLRGFEA